MGIPFFRQTLLRLLLIFLLLFKIPSYAGQSENVVLMAKKNSPILLKLKKSIEKESSRYSVSIITHDKDIKLPENSYLVNVGILNLDTAITQQAIGTISVLITEKQSKSINDQTSIFVEPPFKRQFQLAKLIIPGAKVGLLVKDQQQADYFLKQIPLEDSSLLNVKNLNDYKNLNKALYKVLKDSSLLLGIYDDSIYNAKNIKNILITSYRQQKVLIGPSKAYLKAGSFASTFSDLSHVAKRISDVITTHAQDGKWLKDDFNPYFNVRFNKQVANSLNIQAFDEVEVAEELRKVSHD